MNVNLTPQLEELVRAKVDSGMYSSASEVVREALRLMDEQDRLRQAKLDELRSAVREGLASGASAPWDVKDVKEKARARRAAKAPAA
ncbi:type II toxin-antitoxin system ParD family antitoxin [Roseateles sp.]|uniref:type II toxin-antitoxin system ParD family antitoxin n=1 Tax=Roseateles sp. TaxID=1971397 RepID=UPI002EDA2F43